MDDGVVKITQRVFSNLHFVRSYNFSVIMTHFMYLETIEKLHAFNAKLLRAYVYLKCYIYLHSSLGESH